VFSFAVPTRPLFITMPELFGYDLGELMAPMFKRIAAWPLGDGWEDFIEAMQEYPVSRVFGPE
jgi:hypothetical protein